MVLPQNDVKLLRAIISSLLSLIYCFVIFFSLSIYLSLYIYLCLYLSTSPLKFSFLLLSYLCALSLHFLSLFPHLICFFFSSFFLLSIIFSFLSFSLEKLRQFQNCKNCFIPSIVSTFMQKEHVTFPSCILFKSFYRLYLFERFAQSSSLPFQSLLPSHFFS